MSIPWCPIVEHVTPSEPWSCETCHEHGCDLCDDSTRFDDDGGHRCLPCQEEIDYAIERAAMRDALVDYPGPAGCQCAGAGKCAHCVERFIDRNGGGE